MLLHIYIHSECFLSPITGTLMALKKVRVKGENDMSVLVGSCNCETPESLHTPISRFQLTFKLSQMAFKKYPLPIDEFWSFGMLYPHILLRDRKAVMDTPTERGSACPWIFLQGLWIVHSTRTGWNLFPGPENLLSLYIAVLSLHYCWINISMRSERNKTREVASVCLLTT